MKEESPGRLATLLSRLLRRLVPGPPADRDRLALPLRGDPEDPVDPEGKASILARIFPAARRPAVHVRGLPPQRHRARSPRSSGRWSPTSTAARSSSSRSSRTSWRRDGPGRRPLRLRRRPAEGRGRRGRSTRPQEAADDWFQSAENREKIKKYLDELDEVEAIENNPNALSYERANAWADRKAAEADRRALVKAVDAWTDALRDGLVKLASRGRSRRPATSAARPARRSTWLRCGA